MGLNCFKPGPSRRQKRSPTAASPSRPSYSSPPAPPLDLARLFDSFDGDGDGRISCGDFESLLRRLGSPNAAGEAASMVRAADVDGDGFVSLEEFVSVWEGGGEARRAAEEEEEEELRSAFAVYDRNGDGVISPEELQQVLRGVMGEGAASLAECRGMIRAVDGDGDGVVSFDEFERMMTRRRRD